MATPFEVSSDEPTLVEDSKPGVSILGEVWWKTSCDFGTSPRFGYSVFGTQNRQGPGCSRTHRLLGSLGFAHCVWLKLVPLRYLNLGTNGTWTNQKWYDLGRLISPVVTTLGTSPEHFVWNIILLEDDQCPYPFRRFQNHQQKYNRSVAKTPHLVVSHRSQASAQYSGYQPKWRWDKGLWCLWEPQGHWAWLWIPYASWSEQRLEQCKPKTVGNRVQPHIQHFCDGLIETAEPFHLSPKPRAARPATRSPEKWCFLAINNPV